MIKQTSLDFLSNLKLNNSREWFEQNRDLYENYRSDILQLTENLLKEFEPIKVNPSNHKLMKESSNSIMNRILLGIIAIIILTAIFLIFF